jgi:hypothetical protein
MSLHGCIHGVSRSESGPAGPSMVMALRYAVCWRSAHSTCSRTTGDACLRRDSSAAMTRGVFGAFPSATAMLRSQRSWPLRRIARALGAAQEFVFLPREQLDQRGPVEVVADAEIRLVAAHRELVPRAHQLAVVAAEDAVADQRAQGFVDAAFVFDGEVADAATRVQAVRRDDRLGRADLDAARAAAAVRGRRRIDRQRQVDEEFAEEEPAAAVRCRSGRCACRSSQARIARQRAFPAPARNLRTRDARTGRSPSPRRPRASAGGCASACGNRGPGVAGHVGASPSRSVVQAASVVACRNPCPPTSPAACRGSVRPAALRLSPWLRHPRHRTVQAFASHDCRNVSSSCNSTPEIPRAGSPLPAPARGCGPRVRCSRGAAKTWAKYRSRF